ncbi:hypothetical protein CU098_007529 [Rhizopus stolonifer]|uniref:Uncharacterized protein n=1 Tax=Rhizopus stolonifer TaxID=4846 RepID=A0A367IKU4_RHIST|nr:hypothetical protein CU098_007529 [Rhizopus stolonifer]
MDKSKPIKPAPADRNKPKAPPRPILKATKNTRANNNSNPLKIQLFLNLESDLKIKARIKGSVQVKLT